VDEFRRGVMSATDGLPVVVLQFARISFVQGMFIAFFEFVFCL
jgi:hypothetical protein